MWPVLWGPFMWDMLHKSAMAYLLDHPDEPWTSEETEMVARFYRLLCFYLLCPGCGVHCLNYVQQHPPVFRNSTDYWNWLVDFHNAVNRRTGAPRTNGTTQAKYLLDTEEAKTALLNRLRGQNPSMDTWEDYKKWHRVEPTHLMNLWLMVYRYKRSYNQTELDEMRKANPGMDPVKLYTKEREPENMEVERFGQFLQAISYILPFQSRRQSMYSFWIHSLFDLTKLSTYADVETLMLSFFNEIISSIPAWNNVQVNKAYMEKMVEHHLWDPEYVQKQVRWADQSRKEDHLKMNQLLLENLQLKKELGRDVISVNQRIKALKEADVGDGSLPNVTATKEESELSDLAGTEKDWKTLAIFFICTTALFLFVFLGWWFFYRYRYECHLRTAVSKNQTQRKMKQHG